MHKEFRTSQCPDLRFIHTEYVAVQCGVAQCRMAPHVVLRLVKVCYGMWLMRHDAVYSDILRRLASGVVRCRVMNKPLLLL